MHEILELSILASKMAENVSVFYIIILIIILWNIMYRFIDVF